MEESIQARVRPEIVWDAWEKAHAKYGQGALAKGQKGETKAEGNSRFRYQILSVDPGKEFTILWKTMFVKLLFTHAVRAASYGSEIRYSVQIKGPFAWFVRRILGEKIRKNIALVLKAIVKQLEVEPKIDARNRSGS